MKQRVKSIIGFIAFVFCVVTLSGQNIAKAATVSQETAEVNAIEQELYVKLFCSE